MYSTVKVITAAPVTNSAGQLVCGTPGVFNRGSNITTGTEAVATMTIDNENTNAQAYWGTSKIANVEIPTSTSTTIYELTYTRTSGSTVLSTATYTAIATLESTQLPPAPTGAGTTLTFDTPFIYAPSWAATGAFGPGSTDCDGDDKGTVHYGYLPSTLKDYMLGVPQITSQYAGLASCLIAGPPITVRTVCSANAGEVQLAGGDLTSSTVIMVTPSAEATSSQALINPPISTSVAAPVSSIAPVGPTPTPSQTQSPATSVEIPVQVPASSSPVQSPSPATLVEAPSPVVSTQVQSQSQVEAPAPVSSQVQSQSPATSVQAPSNPQASTAAVVFPIASSSSQGEDAVASAIASLIGAQPVVNSSPSPTLVVSTNLQTVPYNPASSVQGSTVIANDGQTNIVVAQPTTVPAPTLVVSTNLQTIPYNPASSVEGSTIVGNDGQTNIIVSQPTTVQAAAPALVVSTNFATIPYNPASSVEGSTIIENGQTNIVVAQPTTNIALSPSQVANPLAASLQAVGSMTLISGTLNAVLPASQTLLLNPEALPTNAQAQTIVSDSKTYVVLSTPVTIAIPSATAQVQAAQIPGSTTVISGITNVVLPASQTLLYNPSALPTGVQASTIISGSQTYIVLATPVTIPVPSASISYSTTLISGTLNAIIPASQTIFYNPSVLPSGISGSTIVSGSKTYIILSTPVTFAVPTSVSGSSGGVSKLSFAITLTSSGFSAAAAATSTVSFETLNPTANSTESSSSSKVEPSTTRSSAGLPTVIGVATPAATTSKKSEARRVEGSLFGLVGFLVAGLVLVGV